MPLWSGLLALLSAASSPSSLELGALIKAVERLARLGGLWGWPRTSLATLLSAWYRPIQTGRVARVGRQPAAPPHQGTRQKQHGCISRPWQV